VKRPRVLLLAIHKLRDLPGMALLKVLLDEKYGCDTLVGNLGTTELLVTTFRPHLVVLPWLWLARDVEYAKRLKRMGIGVAVLHAEGYAHWDPLRLQIAGKFNDLSPVDLHFSWNEEIADLMREHRTVPDERIFVAGVPRFDFYRPPLQRLLMPKKEFCAKYGLRETRPVVTWATNFGFVKYVGHPDASWIAAKYSDAAVVKDLPPFGTFERAVAVEDASRRIITDALTEIASRRPDVNFVIKVHPGEGERWYRQHPRLARLDNIAIIGGEYIWDVLNSSDIHLHRSCTTGPEAWMMGKPTIDVQLNPEEAWFSEDEAEGTDVARSAKELGDQVEHYLAGGAIPAAQLEGRARLVKRWFHAVDGESAARHAKVISEFLAARATEPRIPLNVKTVGMRVAARLKRTLGWEPYDSLRDVVPMFRRRVSAAEASVLVNRDRYLSTREIESWTSRIREVLNEAGRLPPHRRTKGGR
jgi:surface carbohydrate biosynthesis protein